MKILPIISTVNHLIGLGETPPFDAQRVWKIAEKKFNATEEVEEIISAVDELKPDKVLLAATQQRLILEKLVETTSQQIANGVWNPKAIESLLSHDAPVADFIKSIEKPNGNTMVPIIVRSTFKALDMLIGGFGAELIIVSARPKTGKTTFLLNLAARQPKDVNVLYMTVADYGFSEINFLLHQYNPALFKEKAKTFHVADLNAYKATVLDVEQAIKKLQPQLVVVDRAEKLRPLKHHKDSKRDDLGDIYDELRRFTKRYNCAIVTDKQYSSVGNQILQGKNPYMSSEFMSEDRTNISGTMDMFIGLQRIDGGVRLWLEGRRPGALPNTVDLKTDSIGRYL